MAAKKNTSLQTKKNRNNVWAEEERNLIEAVKKYPCIYELHLNLGLGTLRAECWEAVSLETGFSVTKCKSRWTVIRRAYIKKMLAISRKLKLKRSKFIDGTLSFLDKETMKRIAEGKIPKRKRCKSTSETRVSFQSDSEEEMTEEPCTEDSNSSSLMATSNHNANQSQSKPGKTVLTQDIIEYLLKAKSEEVSHKEDDIFQSMASFVSDDLVKPSIILCSGGSTLSTAPEIAFGTGIESNIKNTTSIIKVQCNEIGVPENGPYTTYIKEECKAFPVQANELTPDDSDDLKDVPFGGETMDEEICGTKTVKTESEIEIKDEIEVYEESVKAHC